MYKHLTIEQRVLIEDRLNRRNSIRSIAKELGVSPSTILREVERHASSLKSLRNDCKNKQDCIYKGLCGKEGCKRLCSKCTIIDCSKYCVDYQRETCPKLLTAPYICNGCKSVNLGKCTYEQHIYRCNVAEKQYRETLVSSRTGFDVTEKEMEKIDRLASPMIKNGLSPYHVKQTLGDNLPVSEATLRRMIDRCELNARNVDLHDKVKRNPRNTTKNKVRNKELRLSKIGHFYEDYLKYLETNDIFTVEMDCVEGSKEDKAALLTLTWKELSFQIAYKIKEQTAEEVVAALDKIEELLGERLFKQVFPLILTDNGHEFSNISAMETSPKGFKRTKIFFCDPNRSDQKGTCENHHKLIRYCIPKSTSIEPYSQDDISLMMNNINSYKRKALFGKSAFELAKNSLPRDFFDILGLKEVKADDIILNQKLFLHSNCNG